MKNETIILFVSVIIFALLTSCEYEDKTEMISSSPPVTSEPTPVPSDITEPVTPTADTSLADFYAAFNESVKLMLNSLNDEIGVSTAEVKLDSHGVPLAMEYTVFSLVTHWADRDRVTKGIAKLSENGELSYSELFNIVMELKDSFFPLESMPHIDALANALIELRLAEVIERYSVASPSYFRLYYMDNEYRPAAINSESVIYIKVTHDIMDKIDKPEELNDSYVLTNQHIFILVPFTKDEANAEGMIAILIDK